MRRTARLLRARRERPSRRTSEQRDELAPPHSITSSARASSASGTVEAERLGGLEIDDQLELGGLLHRQVGRLLALENPAGVDAGLPDTARTGWLRSSSGRRPRRIRETGRSPAPHGAAASAASCSRRLTKNGSGADQERTGPRSCHGREGRLDVAFARWRAARAAAARACEPPPAAPAIWVSALGLVGLTKQRHARGRRNQLVQQLQPLWRELRRQEADAGDIAARPVEAGDEPELDRIAAAW